jgi:hypothetical protein
VGLLDTAEEVKAALAAMAYKREVIMFAENRLHDAAHTVSRLRSMAGYGHVLPILHTLATCRTLAHLLAPWTAHDGPPSCGAYSHTNETYGAAGCGAAAAGRKCVACRALLGALLPPATAAGARRTPLAGSISPGGRE